ncbi:MAG TPA: 6-phosphogluconolactonase [Candidatus Limnocylindrales bacterium]
MDLEVLAAAAWADRVAGLLAARLRAKPSLRVCLPTGDTPVPAYDAVVALALDGACSFKGATVVLLDEWVGLPPGDPARCDTRIRAGLIDRLPVRPAAVHVIDADDPSPEAAAARHDVAARGLDLVVLGLGLNGHVGFNEPGSVPDSPTRVLPLTAESRDAARARYGSRSVPTAGITIGMDRILAAGEVWLLVTGARKAPVLRRALEEPEGPDCPASYLRRHPRLTVFADDGAASLLQGR